MEDDFPSMLCSGIFTSGNCSKTPFDVVDDFGNRGLEALQKTLRTGVDGEVLA